MSGDGRSKRKLASLGESSTNRLNSSAPLNQLVEDVFAHNPKAHRFFCQVLGRRSLHVRSVHCCMVGHTLTAFNDKWDGELPTDYGECIELRATLPRMLLPPINLDIEDPVAKLLRLKEEWFNGCRNLMHTTSIARDLPEYRRLTPEVARCPLHFVKAAAHIQSQPGAHGPSNFNQRYIGRGNLHIIESDGRTYLLHSALNMFNVSRLREDETAIESSFSYDCGDDILETAIAGDNNFIALRSLLVVTILQLSLSEEVSFRVVKTLESKVEFASVEWDPCHHSVLYANKLHGIMMQVNLDSQRVRYLSLDRHDTWSRAMGCDRLHYAVITPGSVRIYDKRTDKEAYSLPSVRRIGEDCNAAIAAIVSKHATHLMYLPTNHHLMCVDLRRRTTVVRYTHGMRTPPTVCTLSEFDVGKEMITLIGQWPEDMTVCLSDVTHLAAGLPLARAHLPYRPPSIFAAAANARELKLCSDPTLHLDKRLGTALTGVGVRARDDHHEIFTLNSLGDVTLQTLYKANSPHVFQDPLPLELHTWSAALRGKASPHRVTDLVDLSQFWAYKQLPLASRPPPAPDTTTYSEQAMLDLLQTQHFDEELLDAWNLP